MKLAERVGFEPTVPCSTPDFESGDKSITINIVERQKYRNMLFFRHLLAFRS